MREKIYIKVSEFVATRPWIVIVIALVLTIISLILSTQTKLETRLVDLAPKDNPAVKEFDDIIKHFSAASNIIIGISGNDQKKIIKAAETISKGIKNIPYVKRVDLKIDQNWIKNHAMMLMKPGDVEKFTTLFEDINILPIIRSFNDFFETEYIEDESNLSERENEDGAIDRLNSLYYFLYLLEKQANGQKVSEDIIHEEVNNLLIGSTYMFSDDKKMLLVNVQPSISLDDMEGTLIGAAQLRDRVVKISRQFPDLNIRLTGMPIIQVDEMEATKHDMGFSNIIALLIVFILFVLAFRMWASPFFAMLTLILGIIWTSGFVSIVIGRFNLMTAMFAVMLIGMGIDYAIHLLSSYSLFRQEGLSPEEAIKKSYITSGSGIITGAVTTSFAFFSLCLTSFDGLIELGLTLGVGILLTLISALTVLPAIIIINERINIKRHQNDEKANIQKKVYLEFRFLERFTLVILKRPILSLILLLIFTTLLGYILYTKGSFQYDMMEMEPKGLESIKLSNEILNKFELHTDYSIVSTNNIEEARAISKKLRKNRLIGRVETISDLVPTTLDQKRNINQIKRFGNVVKQLELQPVTQEDAEEFLVEIERLHKNISEIGTIAYTGFRKRLEHNCKKLAGDTQNNSKILKIKNVLEKNKNLVQILSNFQSIYEPEMKSILGDMANPELINLQSIPSDIKERYMSNNRYLVTIYSAYDVYNQEILYRVIDALKNVSDKITGTVVLMGIILKQITIEGKRAVLFAFIAVFLFVLLDFRSLKLATFAMIPLVIGFIWMLGLFVLSGYKFDLVNVEGVPLILGIGIDYAVHIIHGWRFHGPGSLPLVVRTKGRALILTALTTIIGFGSMGFATHRGLAGLGIFLSIGVASCFITTIWALTSLLGIIERRRISHEKTN